MQKKTNPDKTTPEKIKLCAFEELPELGSRGFQSEDSNPPLNIFLVRRYSEIFAYENVCPHTQGPLDWQPDVFLDPDQAYIQCASHGALFEIDNGLCIYGPCQEESLIALNCYVENGWVHIER